MILFVVRLKLGFLNNDEDFSSIKLAWHERCIVGFFEWTRRVGATGVSPNLAHTLLRSCVVKV